MKNHLKTKRLPLLLCVLTVVCLTFVFATAAWGASAQTFEITKENEDDWTTETCYVTVAAIPDQPFDENGVEPELTMTIDGEPVDEDVYSVYYRNNYAVGTAYAVVNFYWPYDGSFKVPFKICKIDASKATVDKIPAQTYTGWEIEPDFNVRLDGKVLDSWSDYTLVWKNNVNPGTASVTIRFTGGYTGKKTVKFSIVIPAVTELTATAEGTGVSLDWTGLWTVNAYQVQRYDSKTKKYVAVKTTENTYYTETDLKELATYYYKVLPVLKADGKTWTGKAAAVRATTGLKTLKLSLATMNKKNKLTWTPSKKADGYFIYRSVWNSAWDSGTAKRIAKITDPATKAYVDKNVQNGKGYSYSVRSYKKVNGKTYYSAHEWLYSLDKKSVLAGVTKVPQRSFSVYNAQGEKTTLMYQVTLSDRDITILDDFAKKNFKTGWSDEQKLRYALEWIRDNVAYARGDLWSKIESKSYVDAIFTYKLGQCVQYNGAMAAMMVHLGFPARLIMGYRGTWPSNIWQHFWVESPINGTIYVLETGNAATSGTWCYFFEPYSNTARYIKNKKNVS